MLSRTSPRGRERTHASSLLLNRSLGLFGIYVISLANALVTTTSDPGTEWVETFGGPKYDFTYSVAASRASSTLEDVYSSGDIYVVGHYQSDVGHFGNVSKINMGLGLYDVALWKVSENLVF